MRVRGKHKHLPIGVMFGVSNIRSDSFDKKIGVISFLSTQLYKWALAKCCLV